MNRPDLQIVLLGSGNVATHFALGLERVGLPVSQVYSRTPQNGLSLLERLSNKPDLIFTTDRLIRTADLYLFTVRDNAIASLAESLPATRGIWAHTAGSISMEVLHKHHADSGVLYPLQTFSKDRGLDFSTIPLYVEGCTQAACDFLTSVGKILSSQVSFASEKQRRQLHLAAVFACNFVNHLYCLSEEILSGASLSPEALAPLISETAAKVQRMPAREAQTGPAARYDTETIKRHLEMLPEGYSKQVYHLMSESIMSLNRKRSE